MVYMMRWQATVSWVGDGVGPFTNAPASPTVKITDQSTLAGGQILVPGGDSPTGSNFTTAGTTIGTNIGAALNQAALLAQIQGWSTGTTQ